MRLQEPTPAEIAAVRKLNAGAARILAALDTATFNLICDVALRGHLQIGGDSSRFCIGDRGGVVDC